MSQTPLTDNNLQKKRRIWGLVSLGVLVLLIVILARVVGKPILDAMRNKENFRAWLNSQGALRYLIMIGIMALQMVIAIIPGEPVEIAAGYVFGWAMGTVVCLAGAALGSAIVFLAVRRYGMKLVSILMPEDTLKKMRILQNPRTLNMTLFILFLIPGTPKDMITYFVGLTPISLPLFLLISNVARIPSVVTSTIGGKFLGEGKYRTALVVMAITLVVSLILSLVYHLIQKNRPLPEAPKEKVKKIRRPKIKLPRPRYRRKPKNLTPGKEPPHV